jgi:hypothetical protein
MRGALLNNDFAEKERQERRGISKLFRNYLRVRVIERSGRERERGKKCRFSIGWHKYIAFICSFLSSFYGHLYFSLSILHSAQS